MGGSLAGPIRVRMMRLDAGRVRSSAGHPLLQLGGDRGRAMAAHHTTRDYLAAPLKSSPQQGPSDEPLGKSSWPVQSSPNNCSISDDKDSICSTIFDDKDFIFGMLPGETSSPVGGAPRSPLSRLSSSSTETNGACLSLPSSSERGSPDRQSRSPRRSVGSLIMRSLRSCNHSLLLEDEDVGPVRTRALPSRLPSMSSKHRRAAATARGVPVAGLSPLAEDKAEMPSPRADVLALRGPNTALLMRRLRSGKELEVLTRL